MPTLRQGDRSRAVLELQELLLVTGHDPKGLDGIFGPLTTNAFEAFWHRSPITPGAFDGTVRGEALAALRALPRRAIELPRMLTPIPFEEMREALEVGYVTQRGGVHDPQSYAAVRVALAHLAEEHGLVAWDAYTEGRLYEQRHLPREWLRPKHGERAYVWGNNVGNRQVGHLAELPYFRLPAPEGSGASTHIATSACYAFASAAEGASTYWRFLRDHCAPALRAFEAGDPAEAAHQLKIGTWHYSGDEAKYTAGMVSVWQHLE
jgi:peptidoglycan hydrolase-like protein with peptidoglycan-binding domain